MEYGIRIKRNDGEIFVFDSDFVLTEVTGIDFVPNEIFKEPRGLGNGDIITGKRKHSREIGIKALSGIYKGMNYRNNRDYAIAFFNNNYSFDLEITYIGKTMIAKDCIIQENSFPSERNGKNAFLEIVFLSPYSDLFAASGATTDFTSTKALWHDTRIYEGAAGKLAFSEMARTTEKIINYLGSEPAPPVITVRATGYVPGIDIAIDDKKTSIKTILSSGDTLIVDCEERAVTKNGSPVPVADYDAWELMEMLLSYGDNLVKVSKNSNTAFTAEISFVGRYGGL
ncbi:Phage tail protein [Peptostreptococcaceae bacterium pGA-8]|nr:Phage tail protein [Peptostreptococcaceae bacterium pGA-8]